MEPFRNLLARPKMRTRKKKKIKIHFLVFKKIKKLNLGLILLFGAISRIKKIKISNLGSLGPRNRILQLMRIGSPLRASTNQFR
ncbi:hypothetical protein Gotur_024420 [Gossypium turneri]